MGIDHMYTSHKNNKRYPVDDMSKLNNLYCLPRLYLDIRIVVYSFSSSIMSPLVKVQSPNHLARTEVAS